MYIEFPGKYFWQKVLILHKFSHTVYPVALFANFIFRVLKDNFGKAEVYVKM